MRNLLPSLLFLILLSAETHAQCSNNFYRLKEGLEIEMTTFDEKDRPQGRSVSVISNIQENGNAYEATFQSKIYDKKDKLASEGEFVMICEGDKVKIDMRRLIASMEQLQASGMEVEMEGDFLEMPSSLSVGQTLPDGHTTLKVKMAESNVNMSTMNIDILNRKVEGKENVSSTAGNFDCYKITYDTNTEMKVMGFGNKSSFKNTEWIAEGVGTVKTASYDKKGRLSSYTLLTGYKE